MKKVQEIFKNNRYTTIAIAIFILLVVLGFAVYSFLFPNIGSPVYGNRLDGIEDVEIKEDQTDKIEKEIKAKEFVVSASSYMKGRIFNVVIKVKDGTSAEDAKSLTAIVTDNLEEDQRAYFDIQVFLTNENAEASGYPIIGYLNKESENFSYSEAN